MAPRPVSPPPPLDSRLQRGRGQRPATRTPTLGGMVTCITCGYWDATVHDQCEACSLTVTDAANWSKRARSETNSGPLTAASALTQASGHTFAQPAARHIAPGQRVFQTAPDLR